MSRDFKGFVTLVTGIFADIWKINWFSFIKLKFQGLVALKEKWTSKEADKLFFVMVKMFRDFEIAHHAA